MYEFPYVKVCFFQDQACDDDTEFCAETAREYANVVTFDGEERADVVVESTIVSQLLLD